MIEGLAELHKAAELAPDNAEPALLIASQLASLDLAAAKEFYEYASRTPTAATEPCVFPLSRHASCHWEFAIRAAEAGSRRAGIDAFSRALHNPAAPEYHDYFVDLPKANEALNIARLTQPPQGAGGHRLPPPALPPALRSRPGLRSHLDEHVPDPFETRRILIGLIGFVLTSTVVQLLVGCTSDWIVATWVFAVLFSLSLMQWHRLFDSRIKALARRARAGEAEEQIRRTLQRQRWHATPSMFWLLTTSLLVLIALPLPVLSILSLTLDKPGSGTAILTGFLVILALPFVVVSILLIASMWRYPQYARPRLFSALSRVDEPLARRLQLQLDARQKLRAEQLQMSTADAQNGSKSCDDSHHG